MHELNTLIIHVWASLDFTRQGVSSVSKLQLAALEAPAHLFTLTH